MESLPQFFIHKNAKSVSTLVKPGFLRQALGLGFGEWTVSQAIAPLHGPDMTSPQW
jgi:hypothetical protein